MLNNVRDNDYAVRFDDYVAEDYTEIEEVGVSV